MSHVSLSRVLLVGSGLVCLACAGATFAPRDWAAVAWLTRWRGAVVGLGGGAALVFTLTAVDAHRRRTARLQAALDDLQSQVDGLTCDQWEAACLAVVELPQAQTERIDAAREFDATHAANGHSAAFGSLVQAEPALRYEPALTAAASSHSPVGELGPERLGEPSAQRSPRLDPGSTDDVGSLTTDSVRDPDPTALRDEIASLRERVVRFEIVEQTAAAAERRVEALRTTLTERVAEIERLRAEREVAREAERVAASKASEREQEAVRLRSQLSEIPAMRERVSRAEQVDAALLVRLADLQSEAAAAVSRAKSVEEALRHVEDARRDAQRQHAAELDRVTAHFEAERITLRQRTADAEDAVRAALRELGVDPTRWPLTESGVIRAVSPLTLYALGEDTPDWRPEAPEDTLAAAVIDLVRGDRLLTVGSRA